MVLSVAWIKLFSIPYYRLFIDYLRQQGLVIGKDKLPTGKDMSLQNPACDYF